MDIQKSIVNIPGRNWQQNVLSKLAGSKEFPSRLRIINSLRKLWGLNLLKCSTPSGLQLLLDVTDWVQSQIYYFGNYELKSVALVKSLAQDASVIFDIGSHIGQYALECAQGDIAKVKKIFAIEVNPKTFSYLLNNIQLNQFTNVKAVLGAVTSGPGVVNINIPAYWNMGNTQINADMEDAGFDNYLAASFSIISLLKKYNLQHIDLIKIDVEGHEADVMNSLFQEGIFPSNVIFEYIPSIFEQSSEVVALFEANGYAIKDIEGNPYQGQEKVPEQNLWAQKV
jgi:FkbM family methyltransferase